MNNASIWPKGEKLRDAIRWLARQEEKSLAVVEEACRRYNLSPADEEFLIRHFVPGEGDSPDHIPESE